MRSKYLMMTFVLLSAIGLAAHTAAFAQADAGGRAAGGATTDSDSTFRPKAKRLVRRTAPRATAPRQKTAAAYEADGDRSYSNKDYDTALEAYENAVKIKPSLHALYRIAWIHNDFQEYAEALPVLNQAIALAPQAANVRIEKGYSLRHLGRNAEAITELNRAIQLNSSDSLGYLGLGDVYFYGTKEYQKAIDFYSKGLQYDGQNSVAAYNTGWAYNELGNYSEAIKWLSRATQIKPDYASAYSEMGWAYDQLGQATDSINAYQSALQYDPSSSSALFGLGDVYYGKEKNYELAAAKYKSGLAIKSDNANAWQRLGYCYNDLGQYDDAVNALLKAKQLKPDLGSAYVELGYAYFRLQRYNEAVSTFKQASTINPDSQLAHYYLGQVYLATDNRNGAMGEYRTLQGMGSDYAKKLYDLINK